MLKRILIMFLGFCLGIFLVMPLFIAGGLALLFGIMMLIQLKFSYWFICSLTAAVMLCFTFLSLYLMIWLLDKTNFL